VQDFHDCPYCGEDMEQWSLRFHRGEHERAGEHALARGQLWGEEINGRANDGGAGATGVAGDGLTLLSLCPNERCGYYVLRYRNGLTHWDRDVEAARLLRTVFGDDL